MTMDVRWAMTYGGPAVAHVARPPLHVTERNSETVTVYQCRWM